MLKGLSEGTKKIVQKGVIFTFACLLTAGSASVYTEAQEADKQGLRSLSYEEYQEQMQIENADGEKGETLDLQSDSPEGGELRSAAELSEGKENITCENVEGLQTADTIQVMDSQNGFEGIEPYTAPVADLQAVILNEESLKNGQITTDTQIAWLWDFSDADGDTLLNRYLGGFPAAYYLGNLNNDLGFVTQFNNPGHYTVLYQVMDSSGERSQVVGYEFDVVPLENYQVIENSFSALDEVQTYNVTVDFGSMDTAAICLVKTGKSNVSMTVSDEAGTKLTTRGVDARQARNWYFMDKPSPDTKVASYTVSVKSNTYDPSASGFRVIVGDKADVEPMISGLENAVYLDLYTQKEDNMFFTSYTPNKDESWYRFTADGTMAFTMLTYYSQTRFQIRDVNDLNVLFDSNDSQNADVHRTKFCRPFSYAEKARLTTTIGQEYYLVIYASSAISTQPIIEKTMNVTVGKPNMLSDTVTVYAGTNISAPSSGFSSAANIYVGDNGVSIPRTAVADNVYFRSATSGILLSKISYWRVRIPGATSWDTSAHVSNVIKFGYEEDSVTNKNINGTWQMGVQAASYSAPLVFTPGIYISYYYEMGD